MDGPSRVSDVLIITMTLLLTTLAAVAILYKTIQRNFSGIMRNHSNRINVIEPQASKGNFDQNTANNSREAFTMPELAPDSWQKRFPPNKITNSASDSTFETTCHTMNHQSVGSTRKPALQFMTLERRPVESILVDEYAMVQKQGSSCSKINDMNRYSIPSCSVSSNTGHVHMCRPFPDSRGENGDSDGLSEGRHCPEWNVQCDCHECEKRLPALLSFSITQNGTSDQL